MVSKYLFVNLLYNYTNPENVEFSDESTGKFYTLPVHQFFLLGVFSEKEGASFSIDDSVSWLWFHFCSWIYKSIWVSRLIILLLLYVSWFSCGYLLSPPLSIKSNEVSCCWWTCSASEARWTLFLLQPQMVEVWIKLIPLVIALPVVMKKRLGISENTLPFF